MITVVDYGMGNLRSVVKAVELYTDDVMVSDDPADIAKSTAVIMPGDGAFAYAMDNLKRKGFINPLKKFIENDGKFLGICLGYQLLFSESEEFGSHKGLDVIKGNVRKFRTEDLKVPHMGWNNVRFVRESKYLEGIENDSYFYFIHTYYPEVEDSECITGVCSYGTDFTCMITRGNLIAAQFHPEKSHNNGLKIIENFVRKA
ncbi:MAG: imidazole glycerol phosphate synthase subunit HisH [Spirochaetes bacterium]|nr:imidazole glycerol phosphate synthase subunit HisH [Spirochaetota bacterium]